MAAFSSTLVNLSAKNSRLCPIAKCKGIPADVRAWVYSCLHLAVRHQSIEIGQTNCELWPMISVSWENRTKTIGTRWRKRSQSVTAHSTDEIETERMISGENPSQGCRPLVASLCLFLDWSCRGCVLWLRRSPKFWLVSSCSFSLNYAHSHVNLYYVAFS